MDTLRSVIQRYADDMQAIYDNRTAGDYTFTGVLSAFLTEALTVVTREDAENES